MSCSLDLLCPSVSKTRSDSRVMAPLTQLNCPKLDSLVINQVRRAQTGPARGSALVSLSLSLSPTQRGQALTPTRPTRPHRPRRQGEELAGLQPGS